MTNELIIASLDYDITNILKASIKNTKIQDRLIGEYTNVFSSLKALDFNSFMLVQDYYLSRNSVLHKLYKDIEMTDELASKIALFKNCCQSIDHNFWYSYMLYSKLINLSSSQNSFAKRLLTIYNKAHKQPDIFHEWLITIEATVNRSLMNKETKFELARTIKYTKAALAGVEQNRLITASKDMNEIFLEIEELLAEASQRLILT